MPGVKRSKIKPSEKYGKYIWRNWQKSGKLIQRKKWFQIMQKPAFKGKRWTKSEIQ